MLVRLANREDPDQSELGLHCLSGPFGRQLVFKFFIGESFQDFGFHAN